jgi:hypothetical protein
MGWDTKSRPARIAAYRGFILDEIPSREGVLNENIRRA